jgi:ketosteroid isomerase-like protein
MIEHMKRSANVQTVVDILQAEVDGDVDAAMKLIQSGSNMTWVYSDKKRGLFPRKEYTGKNLEAVYPIVGREYRIKNIAEGPSVVVLEMIESYPDPETGKLFRTPHVVVIEFKEGKIANGRHYCDPNLSYMHLEDELVKGVYEGTQSGESDLIITTEAEKARKKH